MADDYGWFFDDTGSSEPANTQSGDYGWFFQETTPIEPDEQEDTGFLLNTLAGAGSRGFELVSNLVEFVGNAADSGEDWLAQTTGINPYIEFGSDGVSFEWYRDPNTTASVLQPLADKVSEVGDSLGYESRFTWENYKDDWTSPKALAGFIVEQGVHSAADMAGAVFTLPAYIASRTQEIAETREVNKAGRFVDGVFIPGEQGDITIGDLTEAMVPAVLSSLAERFGAMSIFKPKPGDTLKTRVGRGMAAEGGTEALQEGVIEYGGETAFTPAPFELDQAFDRGLGGAVAGAGAGGILSGADTIFRGNPLSDAIQKGQQDSAAAGGDGLDAAAQSANNAAATPINTGQTALERQRARMGLSEPDQLADVEDLAGTSQDNPIPVFGATITTPTGTTTIETDSAEATLAAARELAGADGTFTLTGQSNAIPVTEFEPMGDGFLNPEGMDREQLEELYPLAYKQSPYSLANDYNPISPTARDYRALGIPNEQTYLAILDSRRGNTRPPEAPSRPQRPALAPLGTAPDFDADPLQQLIDSIVLNERDMRAAEDLGDLQAANDLFNDNVKLRSAEAQLRRANVLAQEGNQEAADRIIDRVRPILQEEAGRRFIMSDLYNAPAPQPEALALGSDDVIYAGAPEAAEKPSRRPNRVTRLKTDGEPYPTTKSAEAALKRVSGAEPDYDWRVIRSRAGFALEGNLPQTAGAQVINEVTPQQVIERGLAPQRQIIEDELYVDDMQPLPDQIESSATSVGEQIAAFESGAGEAFDRLNGIEERLSTLTARDQSGVTKPNPIQTIKDGDDLILTIVKLGGIDSELAAANGFEPKLDNPRANSVGKYRLFKKNGRTFDDLAVSLRDEGWYPQADPNSPDTLDANEVMEDIREAVNLAQDNNFVYKGDKAAEITTLELDREVAQEMADEFEALVASYRNEIGPAEAGLTDAVMLDSINYFEDVREEFSDEITSALPEGAAAASRDVQAVDRRRDSGAALESARSQRGAEEAAQVSSEESLAETRSPVPPDVAQTQEIETEPQGSVFVSTTTEGEDNVDRASRLAPAADPNADDYDYKPMRAQDLKRSGTESVIIQEATRIGDPEVRSNRPAYERQIRDAKTNEVIALVESIPSASIARFRDDENSFEVFNGLDESGNQFSQKTHERRAIQAIISRQQGADFDLNTYTEGDIAEREERNSVASAEEFDTRGQVDRERELFGLDSGEGTIAGTNDPTQQAQNTSLFSQSSATEAEESSPVSESEWIETKGEVFADFWESASPDTKREILEAADALGDSESKAKRRVSASTPSKLPKEAASAVRSWAATNWDDWYANHKSDSANFTAAEWAEFMGRDEDARRLREEENSKPAPGDGEIPSDAPEHRQADSGVSKKELDQLVEALSGMSGPRNISRGFSPQLFQAPANSEIVRLKNKADAEVEATGFLSPQQADKRIQTWRDNAAGQRKGKKGLANSNLVVLSLFDLTGTWAKPFVEAGYDVYHFDIQENPYIGDINNFGTDFFSDLYGMFDGKDVHAILAACPCTDFASSGSRHFSVKDNDGRTYASVELVQKTLQTIEYFKPAVWAIENPVGRIEKMNGLPPWRLSFDPSHLGEDYTKKTLLWGRFNADLPIAPAEPTEGSKMHQKYGGKSLATKNARSETPEGFAYAFFEANNAVDNPVMTMQNRYDLIEPAAIKTALDSGLSMADIDNIVADDYYIDLDYDAAAEALIKAAEDASPDSDPVFSARGASTRKSTRPPTITDKQFDAVMERVTGKNRRDNERVVVAPSYADLPQDLREKAAKSGHSPGSIRGIFHRGSIYVVGDNLQSESELEEVLFHEATHGGLRDLLADRGVVKSLNGLYSAMGGRDGFEKTLKSLDIEADLEPYKRALLDSNPTSEIRNAILLEEMIAYTGQKGSKGLKLKIQEVIGAIRNWLRKNGFAKLGSLTASDIASIAKRSREQFLAADTESDGTAFSVKDNGERAKKTYQGLYSNAEKILLDEGDKIFKPSKKNPTGAVRGDQIMSFLKGRGVKKDEINYTSLDLYLTDPLQGSIPKRTKEEVIRYLRVNAPELDENISSGIASGDEFEGSDWSAAEPAVGTEYWEHIWDDTMDAIRNDRWDDYRAESVLQTIAKVYRESMTSLMSEKFPEAMAKFKNLDGDAVWTPYDLVELHDESDASLFETLNSLYADELDTAAWDYAEEEYLLDPVIEVELLDQGPFQDLGSDVKITGNDDYGYSLIVDGERKDLPGANEVYDIDEAKIQAILYVQENGLGGYSGDGDTQFFDYLKIAPNDIQDYREIRQTITDNQMGGEYNEYEGGHWNENNVLYHVLVTDRQSERMGSTFTIEELQSDWHNDIRRNGVKDEYALAAAEDTFSAAEMEVDESKATLARKRQIATDRADALNVLQGFGDGIGFSRSKAFFIGEYGEFVKDFESRFTEEGLAWIREFASGFNTESPIREQMGDTDLQLLYESLVEPVIRGYASGKGSEADRYWTDEARKDMADVLASREAALEELDSPSAQFSKRSGAGMLLGDPDRSVVRSFEVAMTYGVRDAELSPMRDESVAYYEAVQRSDAAQKDRAETRQARDRLRRAPPDSPFRDDRYLELAAKRALIQAVEEGKGGIAFSKGGRVQERWGESFNYDAIYNKKLKKHMDKLMGASGRSMNEEFEFESGADISEDGFWGYMITPELRETIKYEGLPMFSVRPDAGRIYTARNTETTMADRFIKGIQDKFLPMKRLQQVLEETGNQRLLEEEDTYLAEEMFYGKTEEDLRQIEIEFVEPLMKDLSKSGLEIKDLDDYLMAKHAKERNREIAKKNAEMPDGGSGMTNADADAILAAAAKDPKRLEDLERLASRVYEMTQLTRDLMVAGGLIDAETNSSWREQYEFYVPLRGFAQGEFDEKGQSIPTGKGYETKGKETKRALGRRSRADSPLVQVMSQLTEKVIRNRKNEVGQSFLKMVENNPDPAYWEVFTEDKPDTKPRWNSGSGQVDNNSNMTAMEMSQSEDYLGVKRDGKQYFIKVRDPRVMDAMRKVGPQAQGILMNLVGSATRWLSFVNTAGDPTFVVANFIRDIQAAGLNLLSEQTKEGGRLEEVEAIAGRAVRGAPKAIKSIANYHRNKRTSPADDEYQRYYQEFLEAGGKTGFFDSPDLDKIAKDLHGQMRNAGPGKMARDTGKWLLDFVTDYNTAVENGIRLSSYVEARKAGVSVKKAASLAKNLTVNFNRKGDHGQAINSTYMFFNAAVQGSAQFAVTMSPFAMKPDGTMGLQRKVNLAQKVAAGIIGTGYAAAVIGRLVGGEDEDGEAYWDKINPAIRERNLIYMKPDGEGYYKFPLPYGYNFFYNLGDVLEGAVSGSARRKPKLMGQVVDSFLTAFAPFSFHAANSIGERLALTATPSVAMPVAELMTNTNFFGGKIYREPNPYGAERSNAHNYFATTKEPYITLAKFMNDTIGGGGEYKSGSVDLLGFLFDTPMAEVSVDNSPDALEHLLEYSLGGIYRFTTGAADTIERLYNDREIDPARIPFSSKVIGRDTSDFADRANYYDIKQDIDNAQKAFKDAKGSERSEKVKIHNGLHLLYRPMLSIDKALGRLRDKQDAARDNDQLTPRARDERIQSLQEQMDDRIDKFYMRYQRHMQRRAG